MRRPQQCRCPWGHDLDKVAEDSSDLPCCGTDCGGDDDELVCSPQGAVCGGQCPLWYWQLGGADCCTYGNVSELVLCSASIAGCDPFGWRDSGKPDQP